MSTEQDAITPAGADLALEDPGVREFLGFEIGPERYALPLSDRKLIGSEIKSPAQSDPTKDLSGSLQGIGSFSAAKAQPDGDILDRSKRSKKMKVLKHHPAMFSPMLVELGGTQGRKIDPGYRDLANIRATQP